MPMRPRQTTAQPKGTQPNGSAALPQAVPTLAGRPLLRPSRPSSGSRLETPLPTPKVQEPPLRTRAIAFSPTLDLRGQLWTADHDGGAGTAVEQLAASTSDPRENNPAWARKLTMKIKDAHTLAELASLVDSEHSVFNEIHVAATVTALPKLLAAETARHAAARGAGGGASRGAPARGAVEGGAAAAAAAAVVGRPTSGQGGRRGSSGGSGPSTAAARLTQATVANILRCMDLQLQQRQLLSRADTRQISNMFWACAKLSQYRGLFETLLSYMQSKGAELVRDMNEIDICNAVYALGLWKRAQQSKSQSAAGGGGSSGGERMVLTQHDMQQRTMAMSLMRHLVDAARETRFQGFRSQGLSNFAWGLATFELDGNQQHTSCCNVSTSSSSGGGSSNGAGGSRGLSGNDGPAGTHSSGSGPASAPLSGKVAPTTPSPAIHSWVSGSAVGAVASSTVSTAAAAEDIAGADHGNVWDDIAAAAIEGRMDGASSQNWANLLWAFAKERRYSPALFDTALRQLTELAGSSSCQECANAMWAATKVSHYHGPFFSAAVRRLVSLAPQCGEQEWANALYACAVLQHPKEGPGGSAALAATMQSATVLQRFTRNSNQVEIAITLWALAVLQLLNCSATAPLVAALVRAANVPSWRNHWTVEELAQLAQVHHELRREGWTGEQIHPALVAQGCKRFLGKQVTTVVADVAATIRSMERSYGVRLEGQGVPVLGGVMMVDLVVRMPDGRRIAIESQGPARFISNLPGVRPKGDTRMKDRWISDVFGPGNVVWLRAAEADWVAFGDDLAGKQDYLAWVLNLQPMASDSSSSSNGGGSGGSKVAAAGTVALHAPRRL